MAELLLMGARACDFNFFRWGQNNDQRMVLDTTVAYDLERPAPSTPPPLMRSSTSKTMPLSREQY